MIDHRDPLERLRLANPVPPAAVEPASSPAALALFLRIVNEDAVVPRAPSARRTRRRARWLVPGLVVAGLAGSGAYAVLTRPVSHPQTAACFERADLNAPTEVVVFGREGPAAACAEIWARGAFGPVQVPALAECTLPSGTPGVFPTTGGGQECSHLGLATMATSAPPGPPGPGPSTSAPPGDENARFLGFRDAVLTEFLASPCTDPATADTVVRRELGRAGLGDWTVRSGQGAGDGFSADRPCATLAFRPDERTVVLVPAPPRR